MYHLPQKQTNRYERKATMGWPAHFRMLCALLGIEPAQVLVRFMETVGCENYDPNDFSKREATSFFVLSNFGAPHFSVKQVRQMLDELAMIHAVYPDDAEEKLMRDYQRWRTGYRKQWYESWLNKKVAEKKE